MRAAESRQRVGQVILRARPEPLAAAMAFNTAIQRMGDRGLVLKPGAAGAIATLIAQAKSAADDSAPVLSDEFFKLPFKSEHLRMLLACLVGSAAPMTSARANPVADSVHPQIVRSEARIETAAWSEADEALGMALQDHPLLERAISKLRSPATGELPGLVEKLDRAARLVFQSVRLAAQRRSLMVDGVAGAEVPFDPVRHVTGDALELGDPVHVKKPAVMRGSGASAAVVVKAEVEPV